MAGKGWKGVAAGGGFRYVRGMNFSALGQFPQYRPRRLRQSAALRRLVRETSLRAGQLVLPFFARAGRKLRQPVASMPGVFQFSPDEVVREAEAAQAVGVPAVLLFGIPERKDEKASGAYARNGIVQQTVAAAEKGAAGVAGGDGCLPVRIHEPRPLRRRRTGTEAARVDNDLTLALLARTALSHAEAGADIVAPSDMMDGRVAAIRAGAGRARLGRHAHSFLCGEVRLGLLRPVPRGGGIRAASSATGARYQMDGANALEALREVAMDIQEGADMVMVKPALAYLDILYRVKTEFGYPTAAYAVSGEYSMIKAAGAKGLDGRAGGDAGDIAGHAPGRGGFHHHLLCDGSGAVAEGGLTATVKSRRYCGGQRKATRIPRSR